MTVCVRSSLRTIDKDDDVVSIYLADRERNGEKEKERAHWENNAPHLLLTYFVMSVTYYAGYDLDTTQSVLGLFSQRKGLVMWEK